MEKQSSIQPYRGGVREESRHSARDFIRNLFRYKGSMAAAFFGVAGLIALLTFVLPETYESKAKVLVKLGRESLFASDPAVSAAGPENSGGTTTSIGFAVNSQMEILNNAYLAERVVDRIGAEPFLGDEPLDDDVDPMTARDQAVRAFMNNLEVHARVDSSVINVSYRAKDAQLAHRALATLLDEYIAHNVRVNATKTSPGFFKERVERARAELERKEDELKAFQRSNGLTVDAKAQQSGYEAAIADLEADLADARSEVASARARVRTLEDSLEGRTRVTELARTHGEENRTADTLKEQRIELLRRVSELQSLHPSDHRLVVSARKELELVEQALAKEADTRSVVTTGIDQTYETLAREYDMARADLEASTARAALLEAELAERREKLTQLIAESARMEQLQRDAEVLREEYLNYRENLHLAQVHQALDRNGISNLSIAQPATLPVKPVTPNKPLNLAAGIVLGLLAAAGLGFTLHLLDDSITTSENVEEHLEIPVLASITDGEFKQCI